VTYDEVTEFLPKGERRKAMVQWRGTIGLISALSQIVVAAIFIGWAIGRLVSWLLERRSRAVGQA
jgi:hypothetical protein